MLIGVVTVFCIKVKCGSAALGSFMKRSAIQPDSHSPSAKAWPLAWRWSRASA